MSDYVTHSELKDLLDKHVARLIMVLPTIVGLLTFLIGYQLGSR